MLGGNAGAIAAAACMLALALAGCTEDVVPDAVPTVTASGSASAPSAVSKLYPNGTAQQNKAFFDATNKALIAKKSMPGGEAVIDNLVKVGFPVKAMQVTPDKTSIGLDAEAIYFSVEIKGQCLIGQIGASFGYHSILAAPISSGACLIGTTRTIDWVGH